MHTPFGRCPSGKAPVSDVHTDAGGFLDPLMTRTFEPYLLRRQDLPPVYYYNCVIDVTRPATIFELKSMTGNRIYPYRMSPEHVIDIDSPRDLMLARFLLKELI